MRAWYREPALVGGAIVFGAASVIALSSTGRALADVATERSPAAETLASLPTVVERPAPSEALLARTVDHDLFHPERHRPGTPFRLPSEKTTPIPAPAPSSLSQLRLLGTVVTPGQDAFVMAQVGSESPRVVRVGGTLGGFTLRKIEPGRAVFSTPTGDSMDLHVPKAGSQ